MTVVQENIKRLRVWQESSFATDGSGTMGNFLNVPFVAAQGARLRRGAAMLPVDHAQQHIDGMARQVIGPLDWTLDFTLNLETFDDRADESTTAQEGALGRILEAVMGIENLGQGDTVDDVSAAEDGFDVDNGSRWAAGGCLVAATGTGGALEARPIESVTTDTIALKWKLSSAPGNNDTVYNAATYAMGNVNDPVTLQFAVEGLEQDDRYLLLGGQLASMRLVDFGPGTVPKIAFSIKGPKWAYADGSETSGTLTGSALGIATYADAVTLVTKDSDYRFGTVGTATLTGTQIEAPQFTFEPNISYAPRRTPAGTETIAGWERLHQPPVIRGTVARPFQDNTWRTARDSRTSHYIWHQIGSSTSTGGAVIDIPTVQVVDWQEVDLGGIRGEQINWEARLDEDIANTETLYSAFRIHLF